MFLTDLVVKGRQGIYLNDYKGATKFTRISTQPEIDCMCFEVFIVAVIYDKISNLDFYETMI